MDDDQMMKFAVASSISKAKTAWSRQQGGVFAMNKRGLRIGIAIVATMAVAGGAYAFTAANTVPNSTAGSGAGSVSGYTVTNLHYVLNAATPVNIDSLTFTVSPVIPSTSTGKVLVQAVLSTGGPTVYTCATNTTGETVTCATTSPQLTADKLTSVTVVAAQ